MFNHINTSAVGGSAIRFFNSQQINTVHCNQMDTCRIGVRFDASNIGDQGSAAAAQENTWYFPTGYFAFSKDLSSAFPTWFYRPGPIALPYQSTAIQMSPTGFVTPNTGTITNDCEVPCPGCPNERMAAFVSDAAEFSNLSFEEKINGKIDIFNQLSSDSTLMYAGISSDLILQNFYDSMYYFSNAGLLQMVNEFVMDSLVQGAVMVNDIIIPENNVENNFKNFNEVYLQTWAVDNFTTSASHQSILENIAYQNPLNGGEAVYSARVLLGLDFVDFTSNVNRLNNNIESEMPLSIVYPNPTNDYIYLNPSLSGAFNLEIYDSKGTLLIRKEITDNRHIQVSELSDGIYFVKIILQNQAYSYSSFIVKH
ncbi:MAG: T9SS type A sorting domain-containing protein [Bacteroidetes bacterium]|nr:T9SS type A sorting domain-containing protein [Bacteroidota bacterium]